MSYDEKRQTKGNQQDCGHLHWPMFLCTALGLERNLEQITIDVEQ
jgi:hypothetical protein